MSNFLSVFKNKKPIMGMLHLKGESRDEIFEIAKKEIAIYRENGVDAVIVEDYYGDKEDVRRALAYLREFHSDYIYGINVLDEFEISFDLAMEFGASFIQTDSVAGHLAIPDDEKFGEMVDSYRKKSDKIFLLGGVRFKYQPYLSGRDLKTDLLIGKSRCDGIVVTGEGTGLDTDNSKISEFREILGDFPLIVGAGVDVSNLTAKLENADGAIVGSTFKDTRKDTGDLSALHVKEFMEEVYKLR